MYLENTDSYTIAKLAKKMVVVLPIAAVEQHGPHLGVGTDTLLVTAVARAAEAQRPEDILLCPTQPIGSSHHHRAFAGTLSMSPQTYVQALYEIVECIIGWGAKRICLLNGHGGNITPARHVIAMLNANGYNDAYVTLAPYWDLDAKAFKGAPPMQTPSLSHACEYETSMMLHVRPEAVQMKRVRPHKRAQENDYVGWEDDKPYRGISAAAAFHYLTSTGNMGAPELSTVEKGRRLQERATAGLVNFIDSFKTWKPLKDLRHGSKG